MRRRADERTRPGGWPRLLLVRAVTSARASTRCPMPSQLPAVGSTTPSWIRPPSWRRAPPSGSRLSGEHTIVALAGATGSGKSSLFNRLTDLDLAGVGVRRPTTSWALACAWGPDGANELLEWMGIPPRHQVSRMSMLDRSAEDERLDGLVLLDLPDHDSTEVEHHIEMDRLVRYADALVWVLDPQKYADAAIHDRYLRPLAAYRDVTVVVLNQIDRIDYTERAGALEDVRRILDNEGLEGVTLMGTSASRGDGLDELKRELHNRIRAKAVGPRTTQVRRRCRSCVACVGRRDHRDSGPDRRRPRAPRRRLGRRGRHPAVGQGHARQHPAARRPADRLASHAVDPAPAAAARWRGVAGSIQPASAPAGGGRGSRVRRDRIGRA